jgi:hypothetical protein
MREPKVGVVEVNDDPLNRAVDMGLAFPNLKAHDEKDADSSHCIDISEELTEEDNLDDDFMRAGRR